MVLLRQRFVVLRRLVMAEGTAEWFCCNKKCCCDCGLRRLFVFLQEMLAEDSNDVCLCEFMRRRLCHCQHELSTKADGVRGSNLRRTAPGKGARPSFGRALSKEKYNGRKLPIKTRPAPATRKTK